MERMANQCRAIFRTIKNLMKNIGGKMEKIVKFSKAFDKRHTDPKKNYGVGCVSVWMILKGKKGAIQFSFTTGLYLPHVLKEWKEKDYYPMPMGVDVGYHSYVPMYKGQKPMEEKCDVLRCNCYYDGSSLKASKWFKIFLEQGEEKIWEMLEKEYKDRFIGGRYG